jgi:hypothetical protein
MTLSLQKPPYGNCLILAPDGQALCRTNQKKIDWYLERNLADLVENTPCTTIKLKFEPSGRRGAEHPYATAEKHNKCVCCGNVQNLTKHHVVPSVFRKYFPEEQKWHHFHDVVPLCVSCHEQYEFFANELKKELSAKYDVPILGKGIIIDKSLHSVRAAGNALFKHWDKIPKDRKEKLLDRLRKFFNKEDVEKEDAQKASKIKIASYDHDYVPFGKMMIDIIPNLQDFIVMWRKHFIDSMKPKFMPLYWDIDYKL